MAIGGLDVAELGELALLLVAVGALSGFLAGLFGVRRRRRHRAGPLTRCFRVIGVPEEVRMPLCVGTSLAIIIPTSIRSFNAHRAKGMVDMTILKGLAVPVVLGVIGGSYIARFAPDRPVQDRRSWSRSPARCACSSPPIAGSSARRCPARC